MTEKSDILIIGGGIIGLMTARELAMRGWSVEVVDRGRLGAEASRAAGGILCPLYPWRLPQPLQDLTAQAMAGYPAFVKTLSERSGVPIGLRRTGLLVLDEDELDLAETWAKQYGIQHEVLNAEAVHAMEPEVAVEGPGLSLPDMHNVYPGDLIDALAAEAPSLGIRIYEARGVEDIHLDDGEIRILTDKGEMSARHLVIAGGAWSGMLLERLGHRLPIRPVKGQVLQYPAGACGLSHMVLKGRKYLVPRPNGELIVGSTLEEAGFDRQTDEVGFQALHGAASHIVPSLAEQTVEAHWAGLRPAANDDLPFIGKLALSHGGEIQLNTGHYQNGILLAPISGRLLAQQISGESVEVPMAPFDPAR